MADIKESDWKIFKKIKEEAINLYCENCLSEYAHIIADSSKAVDEKYVYLYRIVENNDKRMEFIFGNNTSRSKAFLQLLAIRGEGLANQELISQLSPEFQESTNSAYRILSHTHIKGRGTACHMNLPLQIRVTAP